jgi:peptide deformylase
MAVNDNALKIVQYPHPTLRHVSKPLRRVDKELHKIAREMFELMYEAKGIGLAANQVDLPYRMFVLNLEGDSESRDTEFVFLNPVLRSQHGMAEAEEGCLSLPGLYADVRRPEKVTLNAFTIAGEEVTMELDGLFARAVQHEVDHLDGILFIDRLSQTALLDVKPALMNFEDRFAERIERGEIGDEKAIATRLLELEKLRT